MGYAQLALVALDFIKRSWKWMLLLVFVGVCALCYALFKRIGALSEDRDRLKQNQSYLFRKADHLTAQLSVTREEAKSIPVLDSTISALAESLSVKPKDIRSVHTIQGETKYEWSVVYDTVYVRGDSVRTVPISRGCLDGIVELHNDSAVVRVTNNTQLQIVGYIDRPDNWFWKGKWNKKKWPHEVKVTNECDTSMKFSKNIRFEIK